MILQITQTSRKYHFIAGILAFTLPLVLCSCAGLLKPSPVQEVTKAMTDADPFMGDWQGSWSLDDGTESGPLVAQVIALGKGRYRANLFEEFDWWGQHIAELDGQLRAGQVHFSGPARYNDIELQIKADIGENKFTGSFQGDEVGSFVLERVFRLSPTLGQEPPDGAIVLFNGKSFKQWKPTKKKADKVQWKLVGGAMEVTRGAGSIVTRKKFTDFKLHLEFRTPFMPDARGQGRGNSGVYLQGRYEVQILDSYGLEGKDNECGGIYSVAAPLVNMCAPPMQWQTYDITFYAPRFDNNGQKIKNARLTVLHNGVKIHENVEIPKPTGGALDSNIAEPGGICLQDHGNPVQFRNIWLVEL